MSATQRVKEGVYRLLERLNFSVHYRKYFFNLSWLFVERILRMLVSATVGIMVINYLGPERNGILNYAGVFLALAGPISTLGLASLGVKALVSHPDDTEKIIGTSFLMRLAASTVLLALIGVYSFLFEDAGIVPVIILSSSALVVQAFQVPEYYFNASVKAKYIVKSQIVSFFLSNILRLVLIFTGQGVMWFIAAQLLEFIVLAALMLYYYSRERRVALIFSNAYARMFMKDAFYLVSIALVVSLYLRIDQFMITRMLGFEANGKYSAVVKISEMFYFLPLILLNTFFPAIMHGKKMGPEEYKKRTQKLFDLLTLLGLGLIAFVVLFANLIVRILFSDDFADITPVLQLHVVSALFTFWGTGIVKVLIIEDRNQITTITTVAGAIINVVLNYVLIPDYGIGGAAFATVISYMVASWLAYSLFPSTRGLFLMVIKSLFLWRAAKGFLRQRIRK